MYHGLEMKAQVTGSLASVRLAMARMRHEGIHHVYGDYEFEYTETNSGFELKITGWDREVDINPILEVVRTRLLPEIDAGTCEATYLVDDTDRDFVKYTRIPVSFIDDAWSFVFKTASSPRSIRQEPLHLSLHRKPIP